VLNLNHHHPKKQMEQPIDFELSNEDKIYLLSCQVQATKASRQELIELLLSALEALLIQRQATKTLFTQHYKEKEEA